MHHRAIAIFIAIASLVGCNQQAPTGTTPAMATTVVDLSLPNSITFSPTNPVEGELITFTVTVANATTTTTAVSNVPWSLTRDSVANYLSGTIPTIAANGTATFTFSLQETAGSHTYTMTIDPTNTVGDVNTANNTQNFDVTVLPATGG